MRRVGFGAAIAVLVVGFAMTAAGANAPVIKVKPGTTDLPKHQTVHVNARRLPSKVEWFAAECDAHFPAHGTDDCNAGVTDITEGRTGAQFTVVLKAGAVGNPDDRGKCGKTTANNNCVLALIPADDFGGPWITAEAIKIPISFALPS